MCLPVDDGKKAADEQCPADTWSCVARPADNANATFLEGCHFPAHSPLALALDGAPRQSNEAIEAAMQLQCMHPPAVYAAHTPTDDLYDQPPNQLVRTMASLGADRPDHYLCGTPEVQRQKMQLTPQTVNTRALVASAHPHYQRYRGIVFDYDCRTGPSNSGWLGKQSTESCMSSCSGKGWTLAMVAADGNCMCSMERDCVRRVQAGFRMYPLSGTQLQLEVRSTASGDVIDKPIHHLDRLGALDCRAEYGPGYFLRSINLWPHSNDGAQYVGTCVLDPSFTGKEHQYTYPKEVTDCLHTDGSSTENANEQFDPTPSPCNEFRDLGTWRIFRTFEEIHNIGDNRVIQYNGEAMYLDRFPVMCPQGQLLQGFQFKTLKRHGTNGVPPGTVNYRAMDSWFGYYEYQCHDASTAYASGEEYVKKNGNANMQTKSNRPLIDTMHMTCDEVDHAIRGFKLETSAGTNSWHYSFTCVKPTSLANASIAHELGRSGAHEYEQALLEHTKVTILKHVGKQGEQDTILKWAETCGDRFFDASNLDYEWAPILAHEKAADLVKYALVGANAHLKSKQDAVVEAFQSGGNATVEYKAFAAQAIAIKRSLEGLQAAVSGHAAKLDASSKEAQMWTIAEQTVGLNIQQVDQVHQHLHRAYSCSEDSVGCATLTIPSFSYQVYGNELSMYLDGANPKSLRSMAADLEARARQSELMDGMKRLMDNDAAESIERATGLEAQLERLQKEVQLSSSQIKSSHERMETASGQMNTTMTALKDAYKAWQTNQIISAVFEVVTSIAEIVATGGVGAVSVVGKLDEMEAGIDAAAKTAKAVETGGKYLEQFNKVKKLKERVNALSNFYQKLPVAFQAVALGISQGIGCWCAASDRKYKPECTALKKVQTSPPICAMVPEIQKLNQIISKESKFPDLSELKTRATTSELHQAVDEIDQFSKTIAPMTGSYWDDQVADQTATVAVYMTGEIGGAYTAEQAQIYIKRSQTYASAGKDMIAAASRFVAANRDINVVAAQIAANKATKKIKERNLVETTQQVEIDGFLQMAAGFKMTTVASMMYSTMRELCDSLAYQDASTYFQCMDDTYVSAIDDRKNDVRRFCGAFDPRYDHFQGFTAMPYSPYATEQATSGTQAGEYLRMWYDTFHQFDSVKRTLQVSSSKQSASVPRWVTSRVKVLEKPDTKKIGQKRIVRHQLQIDKFVQETLKAPQCDTQDAPPPCYTTAGTCMSAGGEEVDMEDVNKKLKDLGVEDRQVCYHFEDVTCDNCLPVTDADEHPYGVYVSRQQWDAFVQSPRENPLRFSLSTSSFQNADEMLDLNNVFVHGYQVYGDHFVNEHETSAKYQLSIAPGASQEITFLTSDSKPLTKTFVPKTSQGGAGTLDQLEPFVHWAALQGEKGAPPRCAIEDAEPRPLWSDGASVCNSGDPTIRNGPLCPESPTWCAHDHDHQAQDDQVLALPSLFTQWDLFVNRPELDQDAAQLDACPESGPGVQCSNLYVRIMYSAQRRQFCHGDSCLPQCGFGDVSQ